ncbi:MAG TPA: thiamine phosphate synthase [Gemmatimonadaceae bacterium]|jgi:thiamine-phosphate pyrophosphorylase|nr:thiamine phosphate synthase [Gemmatimonadaceae bacterium]
MKTPIDVGALRLIAITDDLRDGVEGLVARAAAAARGGATMVQLRLKDADARTMVEVARAMVRALPVPVVVNDRVDVAIAAGAAGVHVGHEDLPVAAVRRIVPAGFIIGGSVGGDEDVSNASDADYVGIGPVFDTTSKLDAGAPIGLGELTRLARICQRPAVAIGGIDARNAGEVMAAGAAGVAVIRAVMSAPDPERAARQIRSATGT